MDCHRSFVEMGLQDETRVRVWLAAISPLPKNWKFSGTPMTVAESSVNHGRWTAHGWHGWAREMK